MAFNKPELELIDIVIGGLCRKLNQTKNVWRLYWMRADPYGFFWG